MYNRVSKQVCCNVTTTNTVTKTSIITISYMTTSVAANTTISGYTDAGIAHIGVLFDPVVNNRVMQLEAQMTGGYATAAANRHVAVGITRVTNPITPITANNVCACSMSLATATSMIAYQTINAELTTGLAAYPNTVMSAGMNFFGLVLKTSTANYIVYFNGGSLPTIGTAQLMFGVSTNYYVTLMSGSGLF